MPLEMISGSALPRATKKRVASGGVSQAPEIQRHGEGSEITLEIMGRVGVVSNGLYQSTNRPIDQSVWRLHAELLAEDRSFELRRDLNSDGTIGLRSFLHFFHESLSTNTIAT